MRGKCTPKKISPSTLQWKLHPLRTLSLEILCCSCPDTTNIFKIIIRTLQKCTANETIIYMVNFEQVLNGFIYNKTATSQPKHNRCLNPKIKPSIE